MHGSSFSQIPNFNNSLAQTPRIHNVVYIPFKQTRTGERPVESTKKKKKSETEFRENPTAA